MTGSLAPAHVDCSTGRSCLGKEKPPAESGRSLGCLGSGGLDVLGASALRSLLDVELDLLAAGESIEIE